MSRPPIRLLLATCAALATLPLAACTVRRTPQAQPASASSPSVDLVVAATTDVHGRLRGWDYFANAADSARGLARAATIVDSVRAANPGRVVLVDGGDLLQGNPLAYVAARVSADTLSPIVAAMNAMRYDAAAIGNHEFNYGIDLLNRAVGQASFPFLSANSYLPDGRHAYQPWHIVERDGVKVGIVGATTPGVMVWDRDNVSGRLQVNDAVPAVRAAVAEVRAAGADVVVVVAHSGLDEPASYDTAATGVASENVSARLAKEVPGIDLIVFGHSHEEVADTVIGTTLLVQPRNWAASVAVAHLRVERAGGRWRVVDRQASLVPAAGHAESEAVLAATLPSHVETVAYATTTIGITPVAWRADSARVADTPLIDFILEVERKAAGADLASTAAFSLDATLGPGAITVAQVAQLYPYDNTLRAVRISGSQLREYLEHSARYYETYVRDAGSLIDPDVPGYNFDIVAGADYTLDLSKPVGSRVTRLAVKGKPVKPTDSFTMALNNYRRTGGGGYAMLRGAPVVFDGQLEIRQLLIDEVKRRFTLDPADYFTPNWRIVPRAAVAKAYASQRTAPSGPRPAAAAPGTVPAAASAGEASRPGAPRVESYSGIGRNGAPDSSRTDRSAAATGAARAPVPPSRAAAAGARLRVIATNDFHGALEPRPDGAGTLRGGVAAVAATIRRAAAECAPGCETLLLDGGDMFQGTPASNLAYGRPVVDIYNVLGYAAAALGNHEFDWGVDTLRARMRQARYAILGANVRNADGSDVTWIPDDTLVRRGAINVGIIGVATVSTPQTTRAANTRGLRFDDPAPIVDARARALRARGADAIVVVAHAGAFCEPAGGPLGRSDAAPAERISDCGGEVIELARRLTEPVDAIVSGHTHSLVDVAVRGIPVVQARSTGRAVAVVDLDLSGSAPGVAEGDAPPVTTGGAQGSASRVLAAEVRDVRPDSAGGRPASARRARGRVRRVADTVATVDSIARRAVAAVARRVNQPVRHIAADMGRTGSQHALGNLIADAQRAAGGGSVAVINNGGIRADLRAGVATYGSLFEVQPFGNVLYRVTVKGRDLRDYLERLLSRGEPNVHVSGITVTYDPSRPAGSRITRFRVGDYPLADDLRYTLVMNDFMVTGGDGLGLGERAISTEPLDIVDLDALVAYVRAQPGAVEPPAGGRLVPVTR
jgi:2',3'-cyclic-nucleotide 2'-phosphodiesterase (5'-nucleotidase family)